MRGGRAHRSRADRNRRCPCIEPGHGFDLLPAADDAANDAAANGAANSGGRSTLHRAGWAQRAYTLQTLHATSRHRWKVLVALLLIVSAAGLSTWVSFRFSDASPKFFPSDHHIQRAVDLQRYQFTTLFWMAGEYMSTR